MNLSKEQIEKLQDELTHAYIVKHDLVKCGMLDALCNMALASLTQAAPDVKKEPWVDCIKCGRALGLSNIRCVGCAEAEQPTPTVSSTKMREALEKAHTRLCYLGGEQSFDLLVGEGRHERRYTVTVRDTSEQFGTAGIPKRKLRASRKTKGE